MSIFQKIKSIFNRKSSIRITALMVIRNEEIYLEKCLKYLINEGLSVAVIDNGSTDDTANIITKFVEKGYPVKKYSYPFKGVFDWESLLTKTEEVARGIESDWFVLTSPDEVLESPAPFRNLLDGIAYVDEKGFNAINFDELVFIPIDQKESFIGKNYENEMKYYYLHEPYPKRLVRAWKNTGRPVNLSKHGGHKVLFENKKIYPDNFILKHYIFLSHQHGITKYTSRVFVKEEIDKGWHHNRFHLSSSKITLPLKSELKELKNHREYDRSDPKKKHLFINLQVSDNPKDVIHLDLKSLQNLPLPDHSKWADAVPVLFIFSYNTKSLGSLMPLLDKISANRLIRESTELKDFILEEILKGKETGNLSGLDPNLFNSYYLKRSRIKEPISIIDITRENGFIMPAIPYFIPVSKFIHIVEDIKSSIPADNINSEDEITEECFNWIDYIKAVRQNSQYCDQFKEIRIEDYRTNTDKVLHDMLSFMELDISEFDFKQEKLTEVTEVSKSPGELQEKTINSIAGYWRKELGYIS